MRVRFQADADLDGRILRGLRRVAPGIDIRTAGDAALEGVDDPEVLRIAADAGRILVSQDRRTMPAHFARFSIGGQSPGVILLREAIPIAIFCAKQFLSPWQSKNSHSFGARARPRNGKGGSSGFRFENKLREELAAHKGAGGVPDDLWDLNLAGIFRRRLNVERCVGKF